MRSVGVWLVWGVLAAVAGCSSSDPASEPEQSPRTKSELSSHDFSVLEQLGQVPFLGSHRGDFRVYAADLAEASELAD